MAGLRFTEMPVCPRSGIEQDRDNGQIDAGSSPLSCVRLRSYERGTVNPANREMPPAAVVRDREVGVAPPRDVEDAAGGLVHPCRNDPEMRRHAALGGLQYKSAALADGGRGQQFRSFLTRREHDP